MAEIATTIPPKGLGSINFADVIKGLWISIGTSVLALGYLIIQNHFKIPTFTVIEPYLETIGFGFLGYLGKGLSTNNVGQLFQKDKPIVHVAQADLEALKDKVKEMDDSQKSQTN